MQLSTLTMPQNTLPHLSATLFSISRRYSDGTGHYFFVCQHCNFQFEIGLFTGHYDEFVEKMKEVSEIDLNYLGITICGAKKKVNKLTGSMALLR